MYLFFGFIFHHNLIELLAILLHCFSHFFPCVFVDSGSETDEDWDLDIRDEVLEECTKKHGPVVHMFVDKNSQVWMS